MSDAIEDQSKDILISRLKGLEELCHSQSLKRTELESQLKEARKECEIRKGEFDLVNEWFVRVCDENRWIPVTERLTEFGFYDIWDNSGQSVCDVEYCERGFGNYYYPDVPAEFSEEEAWLCLEKSDGIAVYW